MGEMSCPGGQKIEAIVIGILFNLIEAAQNCRYSWENLDSREKDNVDFIMMAIRKH